MRIGIDIDDTTFITVESMIKYADIYNTQVLGKTQTSKNFGSIPNRYYLKSIYGWDEKTKFDFFDLYYKKVLEECKVMPNADKVINKLKKEGNEIIFITARLMAIKDCNTNDITINSLQMNNILYDKLVINASDKLQVCKENEIEVFIEDSYETCKELEEFGIKTYLMTTKMNESIDSGNIERVNDWNEIYNKIQKYIKI